jgi:type I restriction enzyme S subunit
MKWKKVKLTEITKPKQWKNLPISELSSVGFPVYGANGIIGRYKEYNHEFPTLAITCRGATCGTINITEPKAYITSNAMALDDISEVVDQKFLYYALNKRGFKDVITGAAQPQITREGLNKIVLDIPESKEYQLHIANILTKAESLIAQRKESIRLLDEFLKSTFLEMFGDPVRNEKGWDMLSGNDYLSKLTVGVVIKPASYYVKEGVIALRSLNIRPNRIQLDNLVYFSKSVNENELSKSILREGDVVFVRTGMTGTAAIIPKELDGCNCIDLIITRPKSEVINPQYLVFFFNSDIGKRIVSAKEVGGIQKHFNIGALRKLEIPVPPIELQTQFAQIVSTTEALKTQYKQSLQELENLYGSLSQKAFKGELSLKVEDLLSSAELGQSIAAEPINEYKTNV